MTIKTQSNDNQDTNAVNGVGSCEKLISFRTDFGDELRKLSSEVWGKAVEDFVI